MIDLHSHVLPGFDDGAKDWDMAVEMCRIAAADGITQMAATPHIKEGIYDPEKKTIMAAVAELNQRISGSLDLEILLGADVHFSAELPMKVGMGSIPLINNRNYLLLELPANAIPLGLRQLIFELRLRGVFPILTHPERNTAIQGQEERLREFINGGALVQITAMSLTGEFGAAAKKSAERMIGLNLVHNMASDAHSTEVRPPVLSAAVAQVSRMAGAGVAEMLVSTIPAAIVRGDTVDLPDLPTMRRHHRSFWRTRDC